MSIENTALVMLTQELNNTPDIDTLFNLYHLLLTPLKAYEDACDRKKRAQAEIEHCKEVLRGAPIAPFLFSITYTIMLAIPFLIIFYIVAHTVRTADGIKLFTVYDEWASALALTQWVSGLLDSLSINFLMGCVCLLLFGIIYYLVFPCLLVLFPIVFVFTVLSTIISVISAKRSIKTSKQIILLSDDEIAEKWDEISEPLSYVPQDYRSSSAIDHFYRSYCNGRASTLKEAINLYDNYIHYRNSEENQQLILEGQSEILQELKYQSGKINSMERAAKNTGDKVDRMNWRM